MRQDGLSIVTLFSYLREQKHHRVNTFFTEAQTPTTGLLSLAYFFFFFLMYFCWAKSVFSLNVELFSTSCCTISWTEKKDKSSPVFRLFYFQLLRAWTTSCITPLCTCPFRPCSLRVSMSSLVSFWDFPSSTMFLLSVPASLASGGGRRKEHNKSLLYTVWFKHDDKKFWMSMRGRLPVELSNCLGLRGWRAPPFTSNMVPYSSPTVLSRKNHCFSKMTFLQSGWYQNLLSDTI